MGNRTLPRESYLQYYRSFTLPEGRCRLFCSGVPARDVEITAATAAITDPQIRLVFVADSKDTRYDAYGVVRIIDLLDSE